MLQIRYFIFLILAINLFSCSSCEDERDKSVIIRVGTYNVEFGKNATPEEIGEMFKPYNLDIIGFNEAPDGDWTSRVGEILDMPYSYVGEISSANHDNKYKTILSRTPLMDTREFLLNGIGWTPASTVRAVTHIDGIPIAFYSLHICQSDKNNGHAYDLATNVLPEEEISKIIVVGDFNNLITDDAMQIILEGGMTSIWNDLNINTSDKFTWNAIDTEENLGVIDHILYSTASNIEVKDGGIIELAKPLSDHKPVWAEFTVGR